jgi:MFS family permease
MRLLPSTAPSRHSRDFRLLFSSGLITYFGSMMTFVALPLQIKELTGSYIAVGVLGIVELVPLIVMGLWGGALADAVDRKKMVLGAEIGAGFCAMLLLINALAPHPQVWVIYIVTLLFTCCDGLQRPSLDALVPRVVRHQDMAAASTWQSMRWQFGSIIGTASGGLIASNFGPHFVYAIDIATFIASAALLSRLRSSAPPAGASKPSIATILEGARYAASRPDLVGTYVVDIVAMLFAFPNAVFPFFADQFPQHYALGLLYSAGAIGAFIASITNGWAQHLHRHGRMIAIAAATWGAAIIATGFSRNLWLVVACLALAGAADMVSGIFRSTIWNQTIPDEMRGRLAGIELLSYSLGPQVGQLRASLFAQWFTLRRAIISGGVLCIAGTTISAATLRSFWNYDDRTSEHAQREREIRAKKIT